MRKKYIEKRKKFTTNTYMKETIDCDLIITREEDTYITIKKYKKMNGKFITKNIVGKEITYLDEGYYLVEITPINENYNIRFYVTPDKKVLDYYIDITLKNGVEYKIPYYIDLYLDIVHDNDQDKVYFADEDELKEALDNKIISKKDYNLAYRVGNKLLKTLKENKHFNIDVIEYINKYY